MKFLNSLIKKLWRKKMINFKKKKWKKLLKSLNLKYSSFSYGYFKQLKKSKIIENLENCMGL